MTDSCGSTLDEQMQKAPPMFTEMNKDRNELNGRISNEEWALQFSSEIAKTNYETELICLAHHLSVFGKCGHISSKFQAKLFMVLIFIIGLVNNQKTE